jgi:hypothetical protein
MQEARQTQGNHLCECGHRRALHDWWSNACTICPCSYFNAASDQQTLHTETQDYDT